MKVSCSNCGEELLGSVNRCWKCGTAIQPLAGDVQTPPVRRAPIPDLWAYSEPGVERAVEAEVLAEADLTGGEAVAESARPVAVPSPQDVRVPAEPDAAALPVVNVAEPPHASPMSAGGGASRRFAGGGCEPSRPGRYRAPVVPRFGTGHT